MVIFEFLVSSFKFRVSSFLFLVSSFEFLVSSFESLLQVDDRVGLCLSNAGLHLWTIDVAFVVVIVR